MGVFGKLAAVALLALALEGCASGGEVMDYGETPMPREQGHATVQEDTHKPLQCVPYARDHSQVKIHGDAYTWWDQAAGKYPRTNRPSNGAVMVLYNYAGPDRGHVAVVRALVGPREIRVDHANWLDDGAIYINDPVEDVSSENDWSLVRVFNLRTGAWGGKVYPVQGFIGGTDQDRPDLVASHGASMGATSLIGEIN
ncbi:MAG TPA: CHAP domain-containing protein [Rhizomicrobium sp.]|nr:CHAP domain-containing protein [Rhizomicrobium sp.]